MTMSQMTLRYFKEVIADLACELPPKDSLKHLKDQSGKRVITETRSLDATKTNLGLLQEILRHFWNC